MIHLGGSAAFEDLGTSRAFEAANPTQTPPSPDVARELVVKAHSVVFEGVLYELPGGLTSLVAPLTSMIVLPYVGEVLARRELAQVGLVAGDC